MSARSVPLKLQAGKKYVQRNGDVVIIEDNPNWQSNGSYPFSRVGGGGAAEWTAAGNYWSNGMPSPCDLVRPVYELDNTYMTRGGGVVEITVDDDDENYPLECDLFRGGNNSWTREGLALKFNEGDDDLMDYAPAKQALQGARAAVIIDDMQLNPCDVLPELAALRDAPDVNEKCWATFPIEKVLPSVDLSRDSLDPIDVEACWATYRTAIRFGRDVCMSDIIAARKELLNA